MQVYMGIDWSTTKHDVCFINEKGGIISQISVPSNENGFERMHKERCKLVSEAGQIMVGIETSHNL